MIDFSDEAKKLENEGENMAKQQLDKRFGDKNQQQDQANNQTQSDNQQADQPQQ